MNKRIAIIPARGGSKRIPRKNIRNFRGKPIIYYVLEEARESKLFDEIHVSTDDEEISSAVSRLGFTPDFARPEKLADDHTPILQVVRHVVKTYENIGRTFETIVLLYATAVLVSSDDLLSACQQFENGNTNYPVLSVQKCPTRLEKLMSFDQTNQFLEPISVTGFGNRTQDSTEVYCDCASFLILGRDQLMSNTADVVTRFSPYILPFWRSVDIDTLEDWELAERLHETVYPS